jgi:HD-GYP domain-containing protein (c-di-GMP phosphodiesterase class II)
MQFKDSPGWEEHAVRELKKAAGTILDPMVVDALTAGAEEETPEGVKEKLNTMAFARLLCFRSVFPKRSTNNRQST